MKQTRAYRDALARYPTGVALVTVAESGRARVMTVNSFASVSLEPPLVLWSLAHDSDRYRSFRDAERFAVNVLAADQESLAAEGARLDDLDEIGVAWSTGPHATPLTAGAVARFECRTAAAHAAGDHDIIVGEVLGFDAPRDAPALVFHKSEYSQAD